MRFRVGNAFVRDSATHCNFAGDDCWIVRTHPKIDAISAPDGYVTGGQLIEIEGWGLKGQSIDDVEVTIDGVPCVVQTHSMQLITCISGEAEGISLAETAQPGSPGLSQYVYDRPNEGSNPYWNMFYDGENILAEHKLLTAFENTYNNYTRAGTLDQGWFKAPETGNYRFYTSCDNACRFYMDTVNKFDKDAPVEADVEQLAFRWWATSFRDYHRIPEEDETNQAATSS